MRSTSVLTKNPTRSSSARRVRPAIGLPIAMSWPAPSRAQQRRKPGLQHHEQAGARCSRESASSPRCSSADSSSAHAAAAIARHRRPRPVARQIDLIRQPPQRSRPVRQLPRDRAAAVALLPQHRPLPQRVVGVLHRQRRKPRSTPRAAAPRRTATGPAPADPATSRRRRCDAAPAAAHARRRCPDSRKQMRPQRQLARQIKPPPRRSRQRRRKPASLTASTASPTRAADASRISCRGTPSRSGNTVRRLSCRSTRSLSAPSSAARSSSPVKPHRQRDHISRAAACAAGARAVPLTAILAAFQPVQEPQPTLRIRQRDLRRPRLRHQRRRGAAAPGARPLRKPPAPAPQRSAPQTGCGSPPRHPAPTGSG